MNHVYLSGKVANEPVMRTTLAGDKHLTFVMEVKERTRDGERSKMVPVTAFGLRACFLEVNNLAKGTRLMLNGMLGIRTVNVGGIEMQVLDVIAHEVMLGKDLEQLGQGGGHVAANARPAGDHCLPEAQQEMATGAALSSEESA